MDSYQAIYDAVRSRISGFDGQALIDRVAYQFDFSVYAQQIQEDALNVTYEMQRPSTIYRPTLSIDGNQWCAIYGENLQDGVAGFGDSVAKAMDDFDANWYKDICRTDTE